MFKIFKKTPKITVEMIHSDFDSAEERIINQSKEMVETSKQITIDNNLERKSLLLEEIGFVKSEKMKEYQKIKEEKNKIEENVIKTVETASQILDLKQRYPLDKFLTTKELDRLCDKYSLIYAPVKSYIKDVPEKNLLDIKNRKQRVKTDNPPIENFITEISFMNSHTSSYKEYIKERFLNKLYPFEEVTESNLRELLKNTPYSERSQRGESYYFFKATVEKVDKSGLYVTAPKSHFDLNDLKNKSKFGFHLVETTVVNDPIVFEFFKNDIVRIVTKWGTDDDQSYLDPTLVNEKMN